MDRPLFVLLAGPNGSGKSTLASVIHLDGLAEKIDPDRMHGADGALLTPLAAGREVIARTDAHIAAERRFLLETTLSGNREARLATVLTSILFACLRRKSIFSGCGCV